MSDVTQILQAIDHGDPQAADKLLPLVYDELRKLAAHRMANEAPGQTLQPTALVHEAWLRLAGNDAQTPFQNRAHFFGAAAEAMRRILIDNARRKRAARHGGGLQRASGDEIELTAPIDDGEVLSVDEALEKLASVDKSKAEMVKLRYFGGLKIEEAATILGISVPTAKRHWAYARAWLYREIQTQRNTPGA